MAWRNIMPEREGARHDPDYPSLMLPILEVAFQSRSLDGSMGVLATTSTLPSRAVVLSARA